MATAVRKTNWFAVWVSVAVVVVIVAVGAVVVWMNNAANGTPASSGAKPTASNIDTDNGAITFGKGTNTVDTYIDFMCPYCNEFEQAEGSTIQRLVSDGKVTLNVHPVTILDSHSNGTLYSSRAASAMYSVAIADPTHAYAFLQALYKNQPQENSNGLTDQQIVNIAKNAGVTMTSALEKEITSNKYQKYAQSHGLPDGAQGTPTVEVNGKMIGVTMDPQKDLIANLK